MRDAKTLFSLLVVWLSNGVCLSFVVLPSLSCSPSHLTRTTSSWLSFILSRTVLRRQHHPLPFVTTLVLSDRKINDEEGEDDYINGEINKEKDSKKRIPRNKEPTSLLSQEENDRRVMNRLLFFQRFNYAGYFLGVAIIVIGYILRSFGYDYVVDERGLRIDTVEARQFRDEIVRDSKFRK